MPYFHLTDKRSDAHRSVEGWPLKAHTGRGHSLRRVESPGPVQSETGRQRRQLRSDPAPLSSQVPDGGGWRVPMLQAGRGTGGTTWCDSGAEQVGEVLTRALVANWPPVSDWVTKSKKIRTSQQRNLTGQLTQAPMHTHVQTSQKHKHTWS